MAFTFVQKTPPSVGASNFGGLVNDGNHNAMSGAIGSGIQTTDATASPVASPATVTTGTTITVPLNATSVTIYSSAALRISETSTTMSTSYFAIPATTVMTIDVARMASFYLKQDSGSCTVQFFFAVV